MICKTFCFSLINFIFNSIIGIGFACDKGWINNNNIKCIFRSDEFKNHKESQQECKKLNATLLTIHSRQEQLLLTLLFASPRPAWIAMIRRMHPDGSPSDEFIWEDGSNVTFTNYFPFQPKDYNQNCIGIYSLPYNYGKWGHGECEKIFNFICMKDCVDSNPSLQNNVFKSCSKANNDYTEYEGSCYKIYDNQSLDWNEAEVRCQQDHPKGHLVSIMYEYEHAFIQYWAKSRMKDNKFWIGLKSYHMSSQVEYQWTDGWPFYYESWDENEFEYNVTSGKRCILQDGNSGNWFPSHCNETNLFICKVNLNQPPGDDEYENAVCPKWMSNNDTANNTNIMQKWINLYPKSKYCYWHSGQQQLQWKEAKNVCNKMKANLVSIHSDIESSLLRPFIRSRSKSPWFWIGLHKTQIWDFNWEDGTLRDYLRWGPQQPVNTINKDCVNVNYQYNVWENTNCDENLHPFICGIEKVRKYRNQLNAQKTMSTATIVSIVMGVFLLTSILISIFIYLHFSKKRIKELRNSKMEKRERDSLESHNSRYDSIHDYNIPQEYNECYVAEYDDVLTESPSHQVNDHHENDGYMIMKAFT